MANNDGLKMVSGYGNLIYGVLIVVLLIGGYFLLKPQYNSYQENETAIEEKTAVVESQDKIYQDMIRLKKQYESVSTKAVAELTNFLPEEDLAEETMLKLDGIATDNSMLISDYGFTKEIVVDNSSSDSTEATATLDNDLEDDLLLEETTTEIITTEYKEKSLAQLSLSLTAEGSYENFKNFLSEIQDNLRLYEISSFTFAESSTEENVTGVYTYQINLYTYYLTDEEITASAK
ncbi:MAG: hypothetical protein ABIE68_01005 [bacterium]